MCRAVFEHHYQEQLSNTLKFEQHCLRGQLQDTQKKIRIPLLGFVFKEHSFDHVKMVYGSARPAGDIAISGLGWVTVGATSVYSEGDLGEELEEHERSIVRLKVWVPKAVEVFMRPSIPVGTSASQWYEYMDVDDDELETATPRLVY
jgi:hypothetical protein